MSENTFSFEGWAILELMGHRKLAGLISTVTMGPQVLIQVNVYKGDAELPHLTQYYNPSSLYCLTPTTEPMARGFTGNPQPVALWEIKMPALAAKNEEVFEEDDDDCPI